MLTIHQPGTRLCDGLTRRDWLHVGGLGALGLSLAPLLAGQVGATPGPRSFGRARSCILLALLGGPPQHETWDPKPDAPEEVRGPFGNIATSVPGLRVGELMPRTARLAHHCAVLRGVTTMDNAHSSSGFYMLTGRPHTPPNVENARPGAPNDAPSLAALVRHLRHRDGGLPASVAIPEHIWNDGNIPWPGQDGGWLGRTADPWLLHCDPQKEDFRIPSLTLPDDVAGPRLDGRRSLLAAVNRHLDNVAQLGEPGHYGGQARQAFDLLAAPAARRAFDLSKEPPAVRDRYGRNRFGQSTLLARRLVEAGVPLVQVNWTRIPGAAANQGTWDTHAKNAESLKAYLMPMLDATYSALLEDLAERGLLDSTLVVWFGEFGRTPKHNGAAGRDHWGSVFSLALAGGGVRGGVVHGASDRLGAHVKDGRVRPEDLTATIFHLLGHDPETEVRDPVGRPMPLSRGEVIRAVV